VELGLEPEWLTLLLHDWEIFSFKEDRSTRREHTLEQGLGQKEVSVPHRQSGLLRFLMETSPEKVHTMVQALELVMLLRVGLRRLEV
jgi:hypothetical protein